MDLEMGLFLDSRPVTNDAMPRAHVAVFSARNSEQLAIALTELQLLAIHP